MSQDAKLTPPSITVSLTLPTDQLAKITAAAVKRKQTLTQYLNDQLNVLIDKKEAHEQAAAS